MERIDGRIIHDVYLDRVVFRETFTGDGAETEFTLSGPDAAQVTFKYGAWAVGNVKTTLPSHVTKTNKKPAYDGIVPLVRTRIAVTGIDAAGVVTLNETPQAEDFYIWYWYDLPNHHLLENYYREDFVASMEEEATAYGVDIVVDTTDFAGIFTVADNTVQKAFDTADDHIHDGRYYTETELANQTAGSEGSNLIGFHSHTLHDHLLHLTNKGVMEGCVVSDAGTLDITWTSGMIWDSANEVTMTIASGSGTCSNNLVNYLYSDYSTSTTVLQLSTTFPTETDMVLVAIIWCQDGDIWQLEHSDWMNLQLADLHLASLGLFPSWVVSGMTVSEDENADNTLDVTMAAGVLYHGNHHRETIAQVDTRTTLMVRHFHTATAWDSDTNAEIDTANYDNGTQKTDADPANWFKAVFLYTEGKLHWVYPRVVYATRGQALGAPIPAIPPGLARAAYLTAIVYNADDATFATTDWIDIRVGLAEAIASAPVTNHDYLAGITANNHHAQAHKDTHDPQTGGDPLDCAAAGEIVGVAAAAEGNADTLARSNHTHQIQHSIADNHIVTVDGGANQPANTDYAAWTASGLEGRDKTQMLSFLNVADGAMVVNFTNVNAALAAADADIDVNGQDIENINQIAVGHTSPTYDIESRIADYHGVWANRVYSDTVSHTPYLYFIKSHSDTEWSSVETIDDDMLGEIKFFGMDTAPGMSAGARIYAQQVGAAGGMVPTELIIDVANDTAERSIVTFTYSEVTLGTGINFQQANADETHYLGRCAIGWLGSGNEAGFQHRSLDIDGTNYAIQQLNLGATYLNCALTKNIYFQIGGVTVTTLSELDDLTDGGATALHTHAGGDLTFTNVNAVLATANAAIDINSQNLTSVGTIGCGAITLGGDLITDRWESSDTNTYLGVGVCGAGNASGALYNTALGYHTLYYLTSGDNNLCVGYNAGVAITIGAGNVFMGKDAGGATTEGGHTVAIGQLAAGSQILPSYNCYIGDQAGRYNITGTGNMAIGAFAMTGQVNQSHSGNLALGYLAQNQVTTGGGNVAVGSNSMQYNETGTLNTCIGYLSAVGVADSSYSYDTFIGYKTGNLITTGSNNTAIGAKAGDHITSGANNIFIGYQAGNVLTTGSANIIIGYDIDPSANNATNEINIGGTIFGKTDTARAGINIAPASIAAQLHVDQASNSAAIPVLTLDQADVDDAFINFIGNDGADIVSISSTEQNTFFRMIRIEINGTGYWLKSYSTAG